MNSTLYPVARCPGWFATEDGRMFSNRKGRLRELRGALNSKGYLVVGNAQDGQFRIHRLVYEAVRGANLDGKIIDHIDRDKLNNCIGNLRVASNRLNAVNSKVPRTNTSGHRGVSWHRKKERWQSVIRIDGQSTFLGCFESVECASAAYRIAHFCHHGFEPPEHASMNSSSNSGPGSRAEEVK